MESVYCLTQLCGGELYIILLLHRGQLHVSALYNGRLQVVHESLNKQLYKHIYGLLIWERGGKVGTRSRICQNGWDVWDARRVHSVIKLCLSLIIDKSMVGIIQYIYIYICLYNFLLSNSCTT